MFDQYDYQQYGTTTAAPKYTKQNEKPMPSREELLARNSFPSVNQNKHLDRALKRLKNLDTDIDKCATGLREIINND